MKEENSPSNRAHFMFLAVIGQVHCTHWHTYVRMLQDAKYLVGTWNLPRTHHSLTYGYYVMLCTYCTVLYEYSICHKKGKERKNRRFAEGKADPARTEGSYIPSFVPRGINPLISYPALGTYFDRLSRNFSVNPFTLRLGHHVCDVLRCLVARILLSLFVCFSERRIYVALQAVWRRQAVRRFCRGRP